MVEIYSRPIEHPSAWRADELDGKDALMQRLGPEQLDAVDELLARTRHLDAQQVRRRDFDHPALNGFLARARDTIANGRGSVIIHGVTAGRYDEEQFRRIYWGFGTHLGLAMVQSGNGDRLGRVEKDESDAVGRGYRSDAELNFHTDSTEAIGLMCVRKGVTGGESGLVSSGAIHNRIWQTRPQLLPALYEGYWMSMGELQKEKNPLTALKIPVFCCVDGKVSATYLPFHMKTAARHRGEPLPPMLAEGLDHFGKVAREPGLAAHFMLEPGEMMFWDNYTHLHARTAFENSATHKRLLLRLWLGLDPRRQVSEGLAERAETYRRKHAHMMPVDAAA